jgi:hypothetical protein
MHQNYHKTSYITPNIKYEEYFYFQLVMFQTSDFSIGLSSAIFAIYSP